MRKLKKKKPLSTRKAYRINQLRDRKRLISSRKKAFMQIRSKPTTNLISL